LLDLTFPFPSSLGLAEYGKPEYADLIQTKNLRVSVEGKETAVRFDELTFVPQGTMIAGVFSVNYPAGRQMAIRIEYDVCAAPDPKRPTLSFKYVMQTGSHWAGTIGSGQVIFEFWRPVNSKSALSYVNDFFHATDGGFEWDFTDLEPMPEHDITLTFEPAALESWLGRPSYVKDISTGAPAARGIPDSGALRPSGEDLPGGWDSCPAYLLDTTGTEWGWVIEQEDDSPGAWFRLDLDRAHTLAGLRIRTGVLDRWWGPGNEATDFYDTFRRPKTVAISFSDGFTQTVTLANRPEERQVIPLSNRATTSLRLTFLDSYPGTGEGDAYLGVGRIELLGVDAGGAGEGFPGVCIGPNLLGNGDFEQGFGGQGIGLGWKGLTSGEGAMYTFYADPWSPVVYQGLHSQLVAISTYGIPPMADRSAGIYQGVTGLEPGAVYELSLAGLLREEAAHPGEDPNRYVVQWALAKGSLDWTQVAAWQDLPWDTYYLRTEPGTFSTYASRLLAIGDSATLFIRAWKKWATSGREMDVNLDDIALRKCEPLPICDSWDLVHDLRPYPDRENPSRDSYGNRAVWHFMQRVNGGREAPTYELLPSFTTHAFGIQGLEQWTAIQVGFPTNDMLPAVGINTTDVTQSYSTLAWPGHTVRVHPSGVAVVVGWKSPISGQVRISGLVRDMDAHCGNGVLWSIDLGTRTLASGSLGNGQAQGFAQGQGGTRLQSVSVSKGEFLYFIVDPNGDVGCDSTELEIRIESETCAVP
jgi:hypothetical protein